MTGNRKTDSPPRNGRTSLDRPALLLLAGTAVAAFLMAFNRITDTDAWMHLSLGRLIWQTGGLPEKEVFVYPAAELPFSYSSWLFGLLCYAAWLLQNEVGPVLLKASVVAAAFFFVARDALTPRPRPWTAACLAGTALLLSAYRFVLRPDILLMFYLAFSIYSLNAFRYEGKRWIYLLPPMHLLWANTHSSLNLMIVVFGAFIAGGLAQRWLGRRGVPLEEPPDGKTLRTISVVFAASFLASLASPYGLTQYLFASQYLVGRWFKEEILELQPASGPMAWGVAALALLFLLSVFLNRRRLSLAHLLLPLPFFVMPFIAKRFGFLPALVACPVIARNLAAALPEASPFLRDGLRRAPVLVLLPVLLLAGTGRLLPAFAPEAAVFGTGFNEHFMPRGAADYMERNGLRGRVLNAFSFGQYLVWRFHPEVTVFTDARGYIPEEDQEALENLQNPAVVERFYRKYGFRIIVVPYPSPAGEEYDEAGREIDVSFRHPDWALVYWDDLSRLYLHRDPGYRERIAADEYRHIRPDMQIDYFAGHPGDVRAGLSELRRNVRETGSVRGRVLLALLLERTGRHEEALDLLAGKDVEANRQFASVVKVLRADALQGLGRYGEAARAYREVLREKAEAAVFYKLGALLLEMRRPAEAVEAFEDALREDPGFQAAYPMLIHAYRQTGDRKRADEIQAAYSRLAGRVRTDPAARAKQHFLAGIKAYRAQKPEQAVREFRKSIAADPTHAEVFANLAYVYFDTGRLDQAEENFRQALRLNPDNPEAHYGMGLVQRDRGRPEEARRHFEKYIELEPKGYFSRKAERQIRALENGDGAKAAGPGGR